MAQRYISEVTVVLDPKYEEPPKSEEAIQQLKSLGMTIRSVDEDDSVVEGDIESNKLRDLQHLDCVDYVRTVFTYVADIPAAEPAPE